MGYLDNSSITVDAVLTKKGREILKNGGDLNITSFTLSDTGVDYSLWNADHPSGSAFYGEAIENLPMLEANVHAEYNLRNRLIIKTIWFYSFIRQFKVSKKDIGRAKKI